MIIIWLQSSLGYKVYASDHEEVVQLGFHTVISEVSTCLSWNMFLERDIQASRSNHHHITCQGLCRSPLCSVDFLPEPPNSVAPFQAGRPAVLLSVCCRLLLLLSLLLSVWLFYLTNKTLLFISTWSKLLPSKEDLLQEFFSPVPSFSSENTSKVCTGAD